MTNAENKKLSARGYTLIELVVAVGLFALVMLLASGAYLVIIGANRQAQAVATGIDNLSFALETMTRDIRTGSQYCGSGLPACTANSFSFENQDKVPTTYEFDQVHDSITKNGAALTDSSIEVTSLAFYPVGTAATSAGDYEQARVTIVVSGSVLVGPGKPPQQFTIETGATMRGSDI